MNTEKIINALLHVMAAALLFPVFIIGEVLWFYLTFPDYPTTLDYDTLEVGKKGLRLISMYSMIIWIPQLALYSFYRNKFPSAKKAYYLAVPSLILFFTFTISLINNVI